MSFTSFSKLVACALLCALGAACSLDGASKDRATRAKTSGQRPPRTSLPMPPAAPAHSTSGPSSATPAGWTQLDGRRAALEDYRGQVVVLDFYATYCPPCIEGIPHLVELQRRYGPQGMKVVGLYLAQDDTIPQTFVFDRRGQLVRHFVGYDKEVGRELERAIEGALAEKAD